MTPKEKSRELFNKMYKYQLNKRDPVSWQIAIKLAQIAVEEILIVLESPTGLSHIIVFEFWQEVQIELDKLK